MTRHAHFHNYFLSEHGTHMSIGTAVAMGYVARSIDPDMLIIKGRKMSVRAAIDAGIIDEMAADYVASLPLPFETLPYEVPIPPVKSTEMRNSAA